MLSLHDVSKRYGEAVVLAPTDLEIAAGQTTVLIGPSGCGKTTLMRLMLGLITPDTGEVALQGTVLNDANILELRRRMGYVIQEGGLFPHLTARENVSLLARHLERAAGEIEARIRELAALVRLEPALLDRYPGELSGGQRQRVALMRALMLDPEVLLLDEPLGALDPMIRYDLQAELAEIFKTLGKTVVMVTHDMGEAAFFADTVVLLREGRIVQQGSPRDLIDHPADAFVLRFLKAQRVIDTGAAS